MAAVTAPQAVRVDQPAFAWPVRRPLLAAEWRNLAMLNFELDPAVLEPLVPAGTELDCWNGKTYASIVGFQFLNVRFCGMRFPFHANFEEVNLRFYVRRRAEEGWRRGVTFVRELAPRRAVALVARALYGENYLATPMRHDIEHGAGDVPRSVRYEWRFRGRDQSVAVAMPDHAVAKRPEDGSHEQYIIEHYWGYSRHGRRTKEYHVAHQPWSICPVASCHFDGDVAALYGQQFVPFLQGDPATAFWADGSPVRVYSGKRLERAI